jgi:hypothetical protein
MHTPDQFRTLIEEVRTGAISPIVAAAHQLDEIHNPQERFVQKDFTGKLVLVPQTPRRPPPLPSAGSMSAASVRRSDSLRASEASDDSPRHNGR